MNVAVAIGLAAVTSLAHAELPVVCAPCDSGGSMVSWSAPGSASRYVIDGAEAFVKQALDRETFNWRSFNIGPDNAVTFEQPRPTSIALNRIFDADPSRIFGSLKANGQIVLINANGILFERGSYTDTNTLVASTLDIADPAADTLDFARVIETEQSAAFRSTVDVPGRRRRRARGDDPCRREQSRDPDRRQREERRAASKSPAAAARRSSRPRRRRSTSISTTIRTCAVSPSR